MDSAFIARTTAQCAKLFEDEENFIRNDLITSILNFHSILPWMIITKIFSLPQRRVALTFIIWRQSKRVSLQLGEPLSESSAAKPVGMQDYILEEIRKEKQLQAHEKILQMRDAIDEFVAFSLDPAKRRESCWSNAFPLTR